MNAPRHLLWIVVSLIGVASMACGKDQGSIAVEAGVPSSGMEAGGSSSGAEAGMSSSGSTCGSDGAQDVAVLEAVPSALEAGGDDGGMPDSIAGTATFVTTAVSVDLKISITGCVNGNAYPVVIHQGPGCTSAIAQGPEWDAPRGEAIPYLTCTGNSGVGILYYARDDGDPEPWSVGAPSSTDVTGHVVVIHDPKTMQPLACGVIGAARSDGGDASLASAPGPVPSVAILAQLAGVCFFRQMSPTGQCPDTEKFAECACTHCGLSDCLSQCSDTVTCLESHPDAGCASDCPAEPACAACATSNLRCLLGFCPDQVNCAVPTPGGPCSQLEACCARQTGGRADPCLAAVKEIEQLGGDTSCVGTMHDYDFLTHAAYDPPCDFDDAGGADAARASDAGDAADTSDAGAL